jgi:hypothetical protein
MCEDEKKFLLVQPRKHVLNPTSMGIKWKEQIYINVHDLNEIKTLYWLKKLNVFKRWTLDARNLNMKCPSERKMTSIEQSRLRHEMSMCKWN